MTPQEAFQIVDQATAMASLNRPQHAQVVEALNVLNAIVNPQEAPDVANG